MSKWRPLREAPSADVAPRRAEDGGPGAEHAGSLDRERRDARRPSPRLTAAAKGMGGPTPLPPAPLFLAFDERGVKKFRTLIPPFLIVSKTCRADRHSDPTPNNNPGSPPCAWGRFLTIPTTAARTVSQCGAERIPAPGVAPVENKMWSQRRRSHRRSWEMWSHATRGRPPMEKCGHTSFFRCIVALWLASQSPPDTANGQLSTLD